MSIRASAAGLGLVLLAIAAAGCRGRTTQLAPGLGRDSYTLGYQMGRALKEQGVALDTKVYAEALRDGLAGKSPAVSEADMTAALRELRQRVAQKQKQARAQAAGNERQVANQNRTRDAVSRGTAGVTTE